MSTEILLNDNVVSERMDEIKQKLSSSDLDNINNKVDYFVASIFNNTEKNDSLIKSQISSIENLGSTEVSQLSTLTSDLTNFQMRELNNHDDKGRSKSIGDNMLALQKQANDLLPFKFMNRKFLGIFNIPVLNSFDKYIRKFQNSQTVMNDIIVAIKNGRESLLKNNEDLLNQTKQLHELGLMLEKYLYLTTHIYDNVNFKFEEAIKNNLLSEQEKSYIRSEILHGLQAKISSFETQIALTYQGILSFDLITNSNKQLIQSSKSCEDTTVTALNIGMTIASATHNQKQNLKYLNKVNEFNSDLIKGNSEALKTNTKDIMKLASNPNIRAEELQQAMLSINETVQFYHTEKDKQLDMMRKNNQKLNEINSKNKLLLKSSNSKFLADLDNKISSIDGDMLSLN